MAVARTASGAPHELTQSHAACRQHAEVQQRDTGQHGREQSGTAPWRRLQPDPVDAPRSRFVPEALLHLFEHRVVGFKRAAQDREPRRAALPKIDVGAQLLDMWR